MEDMPPPDNVIEVVSAVQADEMDDWDLQYITPSGAIDVLSGFWGEFSTIQEKSRS